MRENQINEKENEVDTRVINCGIGIRPPGATCILFTFGTSYNLSLLAYLRSKVNPSLTWRPKPYNLQKRHVSKQAP